jgi:hypothetical protein
MQMRRYLLVVRARDGQRVAGEGLTVDVVAPNRWVVVETDDS